jgi:hypothetical protein
MERKGESRDRRQLSREPNKESREMESEVKGVRGLTRVLEEAN